MNTATKTRKLRALVRFISHMSVVATALLSVVSTGRPRATDPSRTPPRSVRCSNRRDP